MSNFPIREVGQRPRCPEPRSWTQLKHATDVVHRFLGPLLSALHAERTKKRRTRANYSKDNINQEIDRVHNDFATSMIVRMI